MNVARPDLQHSLGYQIEAYSQNSCRRHFAQRDRPDLSMDQLYPIHVLDEHLLQSIGLLLVAPSCSALQYPQSSEPAPKLILDCLQPSQICLVRILSSASRRFVGYVMNLLFDVRRRRNGGIRSE